MIGLACNVANVGSEPQAKLRFLQQLLSEPEAFQNTDWSCSGNTCVNWPQSKAVCKLIGLSSYHLEIEAHGAHTNSAHDRVCHCFNVIATMSPQYTYLFKRSTQQSTTRCSECKKHIGVLQMGA